MCVWDRSLSLLCRVGERIRVRSCADNLSAGCGSGDQGASGAQLLKSEPGCGAGRAAAAGNFGCRPVVCRLAVGDLRSIPGSDLALACVEWARPMDGSAGGRRPIDWSRVAGWSSSCHCPTRWKPTGPEPHSPSIYGRRQAHRVQGGSTMVSAPLRPVPAIAQTSSD